MAEQKVAIDGFYYDVMAPPSLVERISNDDKAFDKFDTIMTTLNAKFKEKIQETVDGIFGADIIEID